MARAAEPTSAEIRAAFVRLVKDLGFKFERYQPSGRAVYRHPELGRVSIPVAPTLRFLAIETENLRKRAKRDHLSRVLADERHFRFWQRVMTEVPASREHRGRASAQHRA